MLILNRGIDIIPSVVPRRNVGESPEGRLEEILLRQSETGGGQGWRTHDTSSRVAVGWPLRYLHG